MKDPFLRQWNKSCLGSGVGNSAIICNASSGDVLAVSKIHEVNETQSVFL